MNLVKVTEGPVLPIVGTEDTERGQVLKVNKRDSVIHLWIWEHFWTVVEKEFSIAYGAEGEEISPGSRVTVGKMKLYWGMREGRRRRGKNGNKKEEP